MANRLDIPNSNYHIEYEDGKEYNYKIFRHDEDCTNELNYNIVFDLFSMILGMKDEQKLN